ncbi:uncharacterized protein N7446_008549 [Penicillium canescens]|uniref:FAD/NAD(P)-binding domain-containing protein n=1 Tax=Penicillium canescens TaxID=5083 RepID=A0AAD6ING7_PENCN|nr:uncharacterized protein N7446_008549 [Penicillium canescens]KAJ6033160.1 hypothetical protein N7444_010931 [Penicillium canescens]KAJ6057652.1 hypothetical protein N7460_000926 [Penicillium canescens]KAJ6058966.1 hypothetical protein N7446_008549 [Penicillium canescens]
MSHTQLFDALIIGGGPAGLAAAMALGRACRSVALFDSQEYRNESATMMHNVLCHDGQKPEHFRATAVREIMDKYDTVTFIDTQIIRTRLVFNGSCRLFELTNQKGLVWLGRKLIFASGTKDVLPSITGYKEHWGRGIVHCLFCDAYENRGGHIGLLGLQSQDLDPMLMALRLTQDKVTVFTNGEGVATDEAGQMCFEIATALGVKFDHRPLKSISQNPHGVGIQLNFQDDSNESIRMLMSAPPSVNRAADLISSLGLETLPGSDGHVVSKSMMGESSLPGCFVAGDTSTAAKIVHIAMSSGTLAGIGVAKQLAHEEGLKALETMSSRGSQGHL